MITVMLLFHGVATPLICATTIDTMYWASFLCFVVVFSYWTINYIATELEMPFGEDSNDLPLPEMQNDLNSSLITLLADRAQECPRFKFPSAMTTADDDRPIPMRLSFPSDLLMACESAHAPVVLNERDRMTSREMRKSRTFDALGHKFGGMNPKWSDAHQGKHHAEKVAVLGAKADCKWQDGSRTESPKASVKLGDVRLEEGCGNNDASQASTGANHHSPSRQPPPPPDACIEASASTNIVTSSLQAQSPQRALLEVQASAVSAHGQIIGFSDIEIEPEAMEPRQMKDREPGFADARHKGSSSRARSQVRHPNGTVIEVRATACCMPLTPGMASPRSRFGGGEPLSFARGPPLHPTSLGRGDPNAPVIRRGDTMCQ